MRIQFYDRQDAENALNGTKVASADHLLSLIENLRYRPPFFCELVGDNGLNLLIGIGGDIGCTQYSRADGIQPYWMATSSATKEKQGFIDFLAADTSTSVPARFCLPFEAIAQIATHFVERGLRDRSADWEEI
jgi:hypothetical protein